MWLLHREDSEADLRARAVVSLRWMGRPTLGTCCLLFAAYTSHLLIIAGAVVAPVLLLGELLHRRWRKQVWKGTLTGWIH
jgi:hypothetical protein